MRLTNELAKQYQEYVFALFRREGLRVSDAEDQTQETFVRALKRLKDGNFTISTDESLKPWFFWLSRKVLIDFRRKQNGRGIRRPRICSDYDLENWVPMGGAEGELAYREWLDFLQHEAGVEMAAMVDRLVCGYTYREVAAVFEIHERTVTRRMQRAEALLRRVMGLD